MATLSSLNVAEDCKHAIVQGIFNAITNDIPELLSEHDLPTANGSGLFRWNFINKNVRDNIGTQMQISVQKRGPWKFILLYDQVTEFTFSIMTEPNLQKLQRHPSNGIHYLEALSSNNIGYKPIEGQTRLAGCEIKRDHDMVVALREQLLSDFAGIIKNHILIVFDYGFNMVTSVRAVLLTPELDVAFQEVWSQYLSSPYFKSHSLINEILSDDDEQIVSLKDPNAVDTEPDLGIDIAQDEEEQGETL